MRSDVASFVNHLPVRVHFGTGAVAELRPALTGLGSRRWAAVVDPVVAVLPVVRELLSGAHAVLEIAPGEPTIDTVDDVGRRLAATGADGVVAIGGGSALDTAKGARLIAEHGGSIRRFCWPGEPEAIAPPGVPLVAVPTTAGTGSEVTGGIVMTDPRTRMKVAAPSPENRAQVALVDPELTLSLPPAPTLHGALDVLAQAIGAITCAARTPVADAVALESLRLVRTALPAVVRAPGLASRSEIACASLMAGLAMNLSEAGSDHSLGHAVGVCHGVPHGLSVAVVLVAAMNQDRLAVPERFERVADALGAPDDGTRDGSRAVRAVRQILDAVGCPTLGDLGVSADDVPELTDTALAAWIPVSPAPWGREEVADAFAAALAETRAPVGR